VKKFSCLATASNPAAATLQISTEFNNFITTTTAAKKLTFVRPKPLNEIINFSLSPTLFRAQIP
jgi:hypothetical protein